MWGNGTVSLISYGGFYIVFYIGINFLLREKIMFYCFGGFLFMVICVMGSLGLFRGF